MLPYSIHHRIYKHGTLKGSYSKLNGGNLDGRQAHTISYACSLVTKTIYIHLDSWYRQFVSAFAGAVSGAVVTGIANDVIYYYKIFDNLYIP